MLKRNKEKRTQAVSTKNETKTFSKFDLFYGFNAGDLIVGTIHPISRTSGSVLVSTVANLPEHIEIMPNAVRFAPSGADFFADIKKGNKNYRIVDIATGQPYYVEKLDGQIRYLSGILKDFPLFEDDLIKKTAMKKLLGKLTLSAQQVCDIKSTIVAELERITSTKAGL